MTIRVRAHHLLCMLTYVGRGYSPVFTAGYDAIVERLTAGEEIVLVAGPDDICQPMLDAADHHCRRSSATERDRLAADAVAKLLPRHTVREGDPFMLDNVTLKRLRAAFQSHRTRDACDGCEWFSLCSEVADSGFEAARLKHVR